MTVVSVTSGLAGTDRGQLLEQLLKRKVDHEDRRRIPKAEPGALVQLTPPQRGIWFYTQLYPTSTEYNVFDIVHLDEVPDPARLTDALRTLIQRHDVLRVRFLAVDGRPFQQDHGPHEPQVTWYDLTEYPPHEADERARQIGNEAYSEVLRPDQPPLYRVSVIRLPAGRAAFILGFHHLIADDWSWGILLRELMLLLAGEPLGPPPAVSYLDYAAWLTATVDKAVIDSDMAYWAGKLGGDLPILNLPKDRPRPAIPSRRGHTTPIVVPGQVLAAAKRLAKEQNTTLYVVLLAAYKTMLLRITGQLDLIVGGVFAGRDQPFSEQLFGCFVRTAALRTTHHASSDFRDVMAAVHTALREAQDHQSVPYDEIVASLKVARDLSVGPVFQTQFSYQASDKLAIDGVRIDPAGLAGYNSSKWDITFGLTETAKELTGLMECDADLFDRSTVERFGEMYVSTLAAVTERPDVPVTEHSLISPQQRDRILHGLNPYQRPERSYRTLAEPFEEQARSTPDAVALLCDEGRLTYRELNEQANQLAHYLSDAGVGPGTNVALCLERGFAMILAIYAVAKAGGTYVPLDPEHPDDRIAFMLADTGPSIVLTSSRLRARVPEGPWHVLAMDEDSAAWADLPTGNLDRGVPDQYAYLLYTSGSTGRPKAVAGGVDGPIADIRWMQRQYPYRLGDTALFKTSYGFDVSLWEIFWPLYTGATLAVCRPGEHWDVRYLADMIERHDVCTIFLIPTQLQVFLDELADGRCRSLRWVLSGGEAVTARLRDTCHAKLNAGLVNGYGPTETGRVTEMIIPRDPGNPVVPLGRPSPNFRLYCLDENLAVQPIGVPGEAFIGGETGLSHGYHNRPELTADRFLPDPFGPPGARMYRTGDIVKYRADGVLEHLGRTGNQVKIRGMRIELSELEAVLCEQDGVEECVALEARQNGEQAIVAFVVPAEGAELSTSAVSAQAAHILPRYMVPDAIVVVPGIPATVNGKTDRAALLAAWEARAATVDTAVEEEYADELEEKLVRIFGKVLGKPDIGVQDGFFQHGGHSLLVFKLIAACEEELGVRVDVAEVFTAQTARQLADRIRTMDGEHGSLVPLAERPGAPTVVLVHAAGGSALPFREIAQSLADEYSVYALQAPGTELAEASIEELALRYLDEVDPVRGLSPVCLVGWSMGGCVALEMAREWQNRGVSTTATIMLDTWGVPAVFRDEAEREQMRAAVLGLEVAAAEGVELAELGAEIVHVTERNRRAFFSYDPKPFDGRVHLFRATESLDLPAPPPGDGREWRTVISDLVCEETPGTHESLLRNENAGSLAASLRRVLAESVSYDEI